MARAYLTGNEDVRVLVPLDEAKRRLRGTPYTIEKCPPGHGLEADWVGLDGCQRLVIAEAKGSFDKAVRTWSGPYDLPDVLRTALGQAQRTAFFKTSLNGPLPARRWAVASRWANEENRRTPTLLAWDLDEGALHDDDFRALARILHRADVEGVLKGLGHLGAVEAPTVPGPSRRLQGDLSLRVGDRRVERGFAAVLGPIGRLPLRTGEDLDRVRLIRDVTPNVALASLSSRYASTIIAEPRGFDEGELRDTLNTVPDGDGRFAQRAGLTVVWPMPDENIAFADV